MVDYREFKDSLKNLDKDVRMCLLYLEQSIQDKYKAIVVPPPKVDFSPIERRVQSIEQRMEKLDGEREKLVNLRNRVERDFMEIIRKSSEKINEMEEIIKREATFKFGKHTLEFTISDENRKRLEQGAKKRGMTEEEYLKYVLGLNDK